MVSRDWRENRVGEIGDKGTNNTNRYDSIVWQEEQVLLFCVSQGEYN